MTDTTGKWQIDGAEVYPLNDLKEHKLGSDCWCEPFIDDNILVHNGADKREFYERGELKTN